jgi:CubicO group peptidase (beta-lactamase class C family)
MRFRLGSITKQFTAMAILILQAEGLLDVQEPTCPYIPDCPAAWRGITIHHLLTHTSRIPNFTDLPEHRNIKATPSPPDQTIARIQDKPLNFQPGEQWRYSNSGYIVLGYIIEQVSGQSYETFLKEKIFEPLRMANTGYEHTDSNLAVGYTGFTPRWAKADIIDMSLPYAAGGLYSTVEDLYLWDQALYTKQLVSQELMDLMFSPHAEMESKWSYGYGWVLGEMNGRPVVGHDGGIYGFATAIMRYPEDRATIIVLSNRETTYVRDITEQIAKIVFEE